MDAGGGEAGTFNSDGEGILNYLLVFYSVLIVGSKLLLYSLGKYRMASEIIPVHGGIRYSLRRSE